MSAQRRTRAPEELLDLELRDVLDRPERLEADEELEPLLGPVRVLQPELEEELGPAWCCCYRWKRRASLESDPCHAPSHWTPWWPFIFRAILGLLTRTVFASGRRRSPSAGFSIIFFDS